VAVWGGHSCPPLLTSVFLRIEEDDVVGKREDMLELRSAGVPPALQVQRRPEAGATRLVLGAQRRLLTTRFLCGDEIGVGVLPYLK
jgi:hypothetical protein